MLALRQKIPPQDPKMPSRKIITIILFFLFSFLRLCSLVRGQEVSPSPTPISLKTDDANVSATVITAANTDLANVDCETTDIEGDVQGDLILDFTPVPTATASAIASATVIPAPISEAMVEEETDLVVENSLVLTADSGGSTALFNTGEETVLETGDANVSAAVLTFANNNFEGEVSVEVINVYGNLEGDIILPINIPTDIPVASPSATAQEKIVQTNTAEIENTITIETETGDNQADRNTGEEVSITTGASTVAVNTVNFANTNLVDTCQWVVVVNEVPEGTSEIFSNDTGGGISEESVPADKQTEQTNTVLLKNNLELSAKTGGNQASANTNGNTAVKTGDANVLVNLVNFVNTNVQSTGRLLVAVVNIFGRWQGTFIGPGSTVSPTPTLTPTSTLTPAPSVAEPGPAVVQAVAVPTLTPMPTSTAAPTLRPKPTVPGPTSASTSILVSSPAAEPLADRRIKINLAWLVLISPVFLTAMAIKKFLVN